MKKQMEKASSIRALAGGVGLLTTLGLTVSTMAVVSAKSVPHFRVTAAQATAAVLKKFPGHLTEKTHLEDEEGTWQYSVMVRSGRILREVMVDAKTGRIANVEATTSGKEQAEKKTDAADEAAARRKQTGMTSKKSGQ